MPRGQHSHVLGDVVQFWDELIRACGEEEDKRLADVPAHAGIVVGRTLEEGGDESIDVREERLGTYWYKVGQARDGMRTHPRRRVLG
jgi:hypothetical protein